MSRSVLLAVLCTLALVRRARRRPARDAGRVVIVRAADLSHLRTARDVRMGELKRSAPRAYALAFNTLLFFAIAQSQ